MEQSAASIAVFSALMGLVSTTLILPPGIAIGYLLARRSFPGKSIVETAVALPLVLPPVATGFLLLQMLGRDALVGGLLDGAGIEVVFTWKAVVLAMAVMSLPLVVMTVRAGFEHVDVRFEQIAATLGARPLRVMLTISLPLASRSIVAGGLLGFARALGEFGATIVLAGAIPSQTQTLASAIFNLTEAGRESDANRLLLISLSIAFAAMFASNVLIRRRPS